METQNQRETDSLVPSQVGAALLLSKSLLLLAVGALGEDMEEIWGPTCVPEHAATPWVCPS